MDVNSLKVLYTSLPGRYANALFKEGKKASCLDEISENFTKLESFFKNNPSLKKLLAGYSLNKKDLDSGWLALGNYLSFCPVFLNFIRQVVQNKRFDLMSRIKYVFNVALAKYKNSRRVVVSSVVDLLPEQKQRVESLIKRAFKEKVIISYKISPKILSGIKISSEELVVDASGLSQIKQLSSFYKNLKVEGRYED